MTPARAFIQAGEKLFAKDAAERFDFGGIHGVAWVHFVLYPARALLRRALACLHRRFDFVGGMRQTGIQIYELAVGGNEEVALDAHADFFFGNIDSRLDGGHRYPSCGPAHAANTCPAAGRADLFRGY